MWLTEAGDVTVPVVTWRVGRGVGLFNLFETLEWLKQYACLDLTLYEIKVCWQYNQSQQYSQRLISYAQGNSLIKVSLSAENLVSQSKVTDMPVYCDLVSRKHILPLHWKMSIIQASSMIFLGWHASLLCDQISSKQHILPSHWNMIII